MDGRLEETKTTIQDVENAIGQRSASIQENNAEINDLIKKIKEIEKLSGIDTGIKAKERVKTEFAEVGNIDSELDKYVIEESKLFDKTSRLPKLTQADIIVSCISGIVAAIIDYVFVGTPDIVQIYKGPQNFDGSLLTELFRKIGANQNNGLGIVFKWLSKKCKVPYDISAVKDIMVPNNHRLRCFAHDPLFGMMFAIVDIIYNTCTCIDNSGHIRILVNDRNSISNKWAAVIYYLGHLLSDVCTSRGLPIPGFCFLEFFTDGDNTGSSIASIAEEMYVSGYDLRHLGSMSIPVIITDNIINIYNKLLILGEKESIPFKSISDKEKEDLDSKLRILKMKVLAKGAACTGNAVKFIAPPNCGNPNSINMVEWLSLANTGIHILKAEMRDMSLEQTMDRRVQIDQVWINLLNS